MSVKNVKVDNFEGSISTYFQKIKDTKPLNIEEERALWEKFRKDRDFDARDKVIQANLKFVPSIAKQYKNCGLPFADLISEGNLGMLRAAEKFDERQGNKFISYAVWWIRKSILEAIEKRGVLDTDNIDDLLTPVKQYDKDEQDEPGDEFHSKPLIVSEVSQATDSRQLIEDLFDGIPERERYIVCDYYGLDGSKPKTLDEIGEELQLTKERVRQLNEKALKKMRSNALIKNLKVNIG
jgi:RNA polymerase primary sigma factor